MNKKYKKRFLNPKTIYDDVTILCTCTTAYHVGKTIQAFYVTWKIMRFERVESDQRMWNRNLSYVAQSFVLFSNVATQIALVSQSNE